MATTQGVSRNDYLTGRDRVRIEMWTVNLDGTMGDTYVTSYPATWRRYDMLRNLASYVLATHDVGNHYLRPPRSAIRVNSAQGVAWVKDNPARVAYFDTTAILPWQTQVTRGK